MSNPFTHRTHKGLLSLLALACSLILLTPAKAQNPNGITTVFYILLENRCFTSGTDTSYNNILFNNKNGGSPYLTALCTPGSNAYTVNYQGNTISQTSHASFCSAYHHVFATYNGTNTTPYYVENEIANQPQSQSVHPSEPNYIFMEAGSNLSILNDNEPYSGGSVAATKTFLNAHKSFSGQNLSALLQNTGVSWTSYNEGTCLLNTSNQDYNSTRTGGNTLTNNVAAPGVRTVPLSSFSGTSSNYTNPYNGSHQFDFATKHTGQLFFEATNGSSGSANTSPSNPAISHYAPLEQLTSDLANNTQAQYCVITPDQFNDGHTSLSAGFTYHNYGGTNNGVNHVFASGDLSRIGQMDNFCAILVPQIMASPVYQAGHAAIVLWTDETEGSPQNDFYHTLLEIVISPLAKGNAYNSTLNYTHSSDLATMQEVFGVAANTPTGYLNDAANPSIPTPTGVTVTVNNGQGLQTATGQPFFGFGTGIAQDLSDLFQPGVIPAGIPALTYTPSNYAFNRRTNQYSQTVTVTNTASVTVNGPIYVVVNGLTNATLANSAGTSSTYYPGSPYVLVSNGLAAGASAVVTLTFNSTGTISDVLEVVAPGSGTP